ncbi:uncharacterized protein B0T23DRAFT_149270 [Neurospora hispaniola]|uniref:Uncharacterized protein n=1 Tax=Neurospora hispaniola TaxID=588809 RepID=A0AAJ0I880_9PEZI|nr:hypothetical protein B0T23DRAFT_149270 [Neurospora hispaniola]
MLLGDIHTEPAVIFPLTTAPITLMKNITWHGQTTISLILSLAALIHVTFFLLAVPLLAVQLGSITIYSHIAVHLSQAGP